MIINVDLQFTIRMKPVAMPGTDVASLNRRSLPSTPIRSTSSSNKWLFPSVPSSKSSADSKAFWHTPPKKWNSVICGYSPASVPGSEAIRQWYLDTEAVLPNRFI
jgi:hypothetical protein